MGSRTRERRAVAGSLRRIPLFAECTDQELLRIDSLLAGLEVAPGRVLMGRGSGALQFMIVIDGYGRVSSDGCEIGTVGPGSHVGERILHGATWNATITAITPMSVLVLNAGEVAALVREFPSVRARMEQGVASRTVVEPVMRPGYAHA